jgi:predicted permease
MLAWISMVMLCIFLGACSVVIATSCYHIFKLIRRTPGKRNFVMKQQHLNTSHG